MMYIMQLWISSTQLDRLVNVPVDCDGHYRQHFWKPYLIRKSSHENQVMLRIDQEACRISNG